MSHFKVGEALMVTKPCEHGVRTAVRHNDDGTVETCLLTDEPSDHCQEMVQLGRDARGRTVVREVIAFTARSRPATNAYRSGWDATFSTRKAQAN